MPKLSAAEVNRRVNALHKLTSRLGVTERGARYLTTNKFLSAEKAAERIQRMRGAKVPLTGPTYALSLSNIKFGDLIARFESKHKLSAPQTELFNFLKRKGIEEKRIVELVKRTRGRAITLADLEKKVAFLEAIKLNPQKYGVERIPASCYQAVLHRPLYLLKMGLIQRKVLFPLEDAHAKKKLNKLLPKWHKIRDLKGRVRPATLLARVLAAKEKGIKPTSTVLSSYPAEAISNFKVPTMDSMDVIALTQHIDRAQNIIRGRNQELARNLILDEVVKRPHLAVKRTWLFNNLTGKRGLREGHITLAIKDLVDLGALSNQNGYLTVSITFRTGTAGTEAHKKALSQRSHVRKMAKRRSDERRWAMQR